ncbi:nucleotidyl transferase AbiEii/AbiGii toxin family protein [Anaerophaga thermohalophila]|uniref:nucleotidyl transferase AbiEii/AbiGii toxin family protein n=1 Tax=Anaerophaga thermohalophila TaxID=177400 RepID=UPI000237BD38|nr:nucleotidyl transferase AbiEii/AbiGii toxin family protein [Anaerophaga thermohalophila]
MISLKEIQKFYPPELQHFERFILREYLQYKILEIVFNSSYAGKLCFLGGTCLRIVHNNNRFSEDIDFDNFALTENDFEEISAIIKKELSRLGYQVTIKKVIKGAFHCYIRFPGLLFQQGISGHVEEKILIQLDTEPQNFLFEPQKPIINKFDVFTQINSTPKDILLSQKIYAILNRPRKKGRDFYDVVFLLKSVKPNYAYLEQKLKITNAVQLKKKLIEVCDNNDMNGLAKDVEPFLFYHQETKMVSLFKEFIEQTKLD